MRAFRTNNGPEFRFNGAGKGTVTLDLMDAEEFEAPDGKLAEAAALAAGMHDPWYSVWLGDNLVCVVPERDGIPPCVLGGDAAAA